MIVIIFTEGAQRGYPGHEGMEQIGWTMGSEPTTVVQTFFTEVD